MIRPAFLFLVALPLLTSACKKDDEGEGKTGPGTTEDPTGDPMTKFDGNWEGLAVRDDGIEILTSVKLTYDPSTVPPQATGELNLDAQWAIVITADDSGTYVADGNGLLGDDIITITAIDFIDATTISGNWLMDFGNETKEGTVELSK